MSLSIGQRRWQREKGNKRVRGLSVLRQAKYRTNHRSSDLKRLTRAAISKISNDMKLSSGCIKCGYNRSAVALDWHHLGDKEDPVSDCKTWVKFNKEVGKCVVLCANCHREAHAGLNGIGVPDLTGTPDLPDSQFSLF